MTRKTNHGGAESTEFGPCADAHEPGLVKELS
jgi:hypothetical protein